MKKTIQAVKKPFFLARIWRWFKYKVILRKRLKHEHNLRIASEVGYLFISKYANDRTFRRRMEREEPNLCRVIDKLIVNIKE